MRYIQYHHLFSDFSNPPTGKLFDEPKNVDDILGKMNGKLFLSQIDLFFFKEKLRKNN